MALVIEDGTVVAGANSYITVEEARTYAASRGVELPTEDQELIPMILQAADFINAYEPKFKGKRVSAEQMMAWPRKGVNFYDADYPDDGIPPQIRFAQLQATINVVNGVDLMPNITGFAVRREKVDVIEVEYATGGGLNNTSTAQLTPAFPLIDSTLAPLLRPVKMLTAARA